MSEGYPRLTKWMTWRTVEGSQRKIGDLETVELVAGEPEPGLPWLCGVADPGTRPGDSHYHGTEAEAAACIVSHPNG